MTPVNATPGAGKAAPPSFLAASLRIFDLSLGEMLWSRRTVFMALVVGGPVVIAAVVRVMSGIFGPPKAQNVSIDGPTIFGLMIWVFYLRFTVPVLGVFYGTALMADEVEDRTLTYLFTRPIPRGAVLVGKYLAYLVCTVCIVLPSVVVVYLLIVPIRGHLGAAFPSLLVDLALLGAGLAVYGAFFAFVGAQLKRPLLIGLIFVFGWEQAAMSIPGYMRNLTIAHYLQGLAPHAMPQDNVVSMIQSVFQSSPSVSTSLVRLALIWAVALWLATRAVSRREYVLEQ